MTLKQAEQIMLLDKKKHVFKKRENIYKKGIIMGKNLVFSKYLD